MAEQAASKESKNGPPIIPTGATVAIFGASGDLTARKLLPALFDLWHAGYLTDDSPIVGIARREKTDESFREEIFEAINGHVRAGAISPAQWAKFSQRLFYRHLDISNPAEYGTLQRQLEDIERQGSQRNNRVIYMATSPDLFIPAVEGLAGAGMIPGRDSETWLRVVFEKPFGLAIAGIRAPFGKRVVL